MLIASATFSLKCHSLETGQVVHNYAPSLPKKGYIKHLTWNKGGSWLSLTPTQGYALIITLKNEIIRELHTISSIQEPTCSIFKHDTKKYLSVGTANGSVLTYDLKREAIIKKYPKVESGVFSLHYCANDSHLIAGCTNGEVIILNTNTSVKSSKFRVPNSKTLSCLKPHQNKRSLIAAGSENGFVAIWDLNQCKIKYSHKIHNAPVKDITFLPNRDDILFTIGMDKKMCFQDTRNNVQISEINCEDILTCLDVSFNATNIVIGTESGDIFIYDVRNIKVPKMIIKKAHDGAWIQTIALQTMTDHITAEDNSLEIIPNSTTLSAISAELTLIKQPSLNDSFIDEFGINESINSPLQNVLNKRRSSQNFNFKQKSTSECSEADSFLDVLGFNSPAQLSTRTSVGPITKEIKNLLKEKPEILDPNKSADMSPIQILNKNIRKSLMHEVTNKKQNELDLAPDEVIKNLQTSTPKIYANDENAAFNNFENIRRIVKEIVTEQIELFKTDIELVVKNEMRLMKDEFKEIIKDVASQQTANNWRLMQLQQQIEADLHLQRVKDQMIMEENLIDLAKLITGEAFDE